MEIRPVLRSDLAAIDRIYNHYVKHSHATFDVRPFSEAGRIDWLRRFDHDRYQCWVATHLGRLQGWTCSAPLKAKPAYDTSVEVSIYLHPESCGQGLGRALYGRLFESLADRDLHRAYALIALPNEASMKLHQAFGFRQVAQLTEVGRKFGRYWDVVWLEKALPDGIP